MWSIVGQILPLAVAMVTIPKLLHSLGDERFGLLMLFWMLVGYFTILDLGLGRALILVFSRLRPVIDKEEISAVFWTGSTILFLVGFVMAVLVQFLAPWICELLSVAPALRVEAIGAIRISGWTLPPLLLLHPMMGLPTAFQRQRGLNLLRIPAGILSHLVPLTMVFWTTDLRHLMLGNLALRTFLLVVHFFYAIHVQPITWPPRATRATAFGLLSISSWMMLTNLLAPLLMNIDRLLISHRLSAGALACYSPAMDMAGKALILVGGSFSVLFPALGHHLKNAPAHAVEVYTSTLRSVAWWITPFVIFGAGVARPFMVLWLGKTHGESAGIFLAIFFLGVLCSVAGQICFAAVQAADDARKASFVHAAELPIYLFLLWLCLRNGNLMAVAWVWAFRHLLDTAALHVIARSRGLKSSRDSAFIVPILVGMALMFPIPFLHMYSAYLGVVAGVAICAIWCAVAWFSKAGQKAIPGFVHSYAPFLFR